MSKILGAVIIILVILTVGTIALSGLVIGTYNKLVASRLAYETQWAQVENQLQRRFDLIPNLTNAVKGIFNQEQKVFGAIAEARTKYSGATTVKDKVEASSNLEGALSRLLVVIENYPDLKSNAQVIGLMDELAGTENRISVERTRYNETVQYYNTEIKIFPTNIIAGIFNFQAAPLFKAAEGSQLAPEVDLTK